MNRFDRANVVRDPEVCRDYAVTRRYCEVCGTPEAQAAWPGLSVHHLCQGAVRSDEICNLLVVCAICHGLAHGQTIRVGGIPLPQLTKGVMFMAKKLRDPANWNEARLEELRRQACPALEAIPEYFARLWRHWKGEQA